MRLLRISGDLT
jgi:hypothetical protein